MLIDEYTEQSDITALLNAHESYMLDNKEATEIIEQVQDAIKDWRAVAEHEHISVITIAKDASCWDDLKIK